jgi:hypothetical protein
MEVIQPYQVGIRYQPPCLYVYYSCNLGITIFNTGKRRRKIPLHVIQKLLKTKQKEQVNVSSIIQSLQNNHTNYVKPIAPTQLRELLYKVLSHHKLNFIQQKPTATNILGDLPPLPVSKPNVPAVPAVPVVDVNQNLNKLDDNDLKKVKDAMNVQFEANRVKKDDPGFTYDVKVFLN